MTTPVYNTGINRTGAYGGGSGPDPLVPEPLAQDVIAELPKQSAILSLARKTQMSTKTQRQAVLDVLPTAYFVGGDSGLKQTTNAEWKNVFLIAEELAVIVPIPDAYLSDATMPIWDLVRPLMVEALGRKIDAACLFGDDRPTTWSAGLYDSAVAAGNTVSRGSGVDLPQEVAMLAQVVTQDGYTNFNGWAVKPGFKWQLVQTRSQYGNPIYEPDLQDGRGGQLYGYPMFETVNGGWDPNAADLIGGDWSKAIVGMRQDITFKMFDQGVIADNTGKVIWSAMQNDGQAMRVVMRLGWATANPVTPLNSNDATRFPFGVLHPAGLYS